MRRRAVLCGGPSCVTSLPTRTQRRGAKSAPQYGQVRVDGGTTEGVEIPLDPGTSGKGPDRPVFIAGTELAETLTLRNYGAAAGAGTARITVDPQASIGTTLTVAEAIAPADSWIVVQEDRSGRPGKVLSFAPLTGGRFVEQPVALTSGPPREDFFVTLFADSGVAGRFEFDPASPLSSADQPYYVGGVPVRAEVPVTLK
jgi:hypothetical protein